MEPPPSNVQGESSLGLTCASPVSRSVSDSEDSDGEDSDREDSDGEDLNWEDLDWEDDYMMWGQLADAEIAVTRGLL